jgi:hypothetical protein
MLRSQLGLGQYDRVMAEGGGGGGTDKAPALQALALHASYLSSSSSSSSSDGGDHHHHRLAVIDKLKVLLASTPDSR